MILLTNWYGTGSGSDLAPCTQRHPSPPGRYRSLYRTVLRIRQQYQHSRRSKRCGVDELHKHSEKAVNACEDITGLLGDHA